MKPIRYHPEAEQEYEAALEEYFNIDYELGTRLREAVLEARTRLQERPMSFPKDEETECRLKTVKGFRYSIYYLERDECIWIVAIAHHRRKPYYWRGRLRGL